MNKAKFWLVQIAMVAIVGLVFGSPVLAGPSMDAMSKSNASDTGKANASSTAGGDGNHGGNGGGNPQGDETSTGTSDPVCTSSDTSGCAADTCPTTWDDSTSTCSFY